MRVKCLAQEHTELPRPLLECGRPDPESIALIIFHRSSHKLKCIKQIFSKPKKKIRVVGCTGSGLKKNIRKLKIPLPPSLF